MTIRFKPGKMPTQEEIIEEAIGAGWDLDMNSLEARCLVTMCFKIYNIGVDVGIERYRTELKALNDKIRERFESNRNRTETESV